MNTRRPTHAAGDSWGKWEDPLLYGTLEDSGQAQAPDWWAIAIFWLACLLIGSVAALWAQTIF